MSMTSVETSSSEVATYGGLVDAAGGAATVVLAIIGLSGTKADILLAIATIVFGAALLIQSGTILSELTHMIFPPAQPILPKNSAPAACRWSSWLGPRELCWESWR